MLLTWFELQAAGSRADLGDEQLHFGMRQNVPLGKPLLGSHVLPQAKGLQGDARCMAAMVSLLARGAWQVRGARERAVLWVHLPTCEVNRGVHLPKDWVWHCRQAVCH